MSSCRPHLFFLFRVSSPPSTMRTFKFIHLINKAQFPFSQTKREWFHNMEQFMWKRHLTPKILRTFFATSLRFLSKSQKKSNAARGDLMTCPAQGSLASPRGEYHRTHSHQDVIPDNLHSRLQATKLCKPLAIQRSSRHSTDRLRYTSTRL